MPHAQASGTGAKRRTGPKPLTKATGKIRTSPNARARGGADGARVALNESHDDLNRISDDEFNKGMLTIQLHLMTKSAEMATRLLETDTDKDQFRQFLGSCLRHRVVSAPEMIDDLKIDKSGPSRWGMEGGTTAPVVAIRRLVLDYIARSARQQADAIAAKIEPGLHVRD